MSTQWHQLLPHKNNARFEKVPGRSAWFEIRRINHHTYAILEPNHIEEVICYLIIGQERAVLFDAGMGIADIRAEVTALTSLPVTVINSHCHYDHMGGNHRFEDIRSFEHPFENGRMESGYTNSECKKYMTDGSYINLPAYIDLNTFFVPGVRITKYLHAGDTIDLGGRTLTIHHTPGETPGAISLYDDQYNIFFTGDLLHPGGMWLHQQESDWNSFGRSINYLQAHLGNAQYICPAHNEFCISPAFVSKVQQAIAAVNNHASQGIPKEDFLAFPFDGFSFYLPKDRQ